MKRLFSLLALLAALPLGAQTTGLEPGIARYNARRWSDARAFFAGAAQAQPRNAEAAYWLGKALMAENKPGEAEGWFDKATQIDAGSSEYHLWLARALSVQAQRANVLKQPLLAGRMKAAVDRAIVLDPNNIDARELRWQFYSMAPALMGGGMDKARGEAAQITRLNRYRGLLLELQVAESAKDEAAAQRTLMAMMAGYADSLQPVSLYAMRLADQGRAPEAFAMVDAFQKRHPADAAVPYLVGRISASSGQELDRGEQALRKYLTGGSHPALDMATQSNAHFRLGIIREKRGDRAGARAEYLWSVRLDSRNEAAKRALAALK